MAWKQFDTGAADEVASQSRDNIEVPVGTWKALVDDIYETRKTGEMYYDKFSGERKALLKIDVLDGPGEGGVFFKDLFIFPENSEKKMKKSMTFLSALCKSCGYVGPINKENLIGKVLTIDVVVKKNGNGTTFKVHVKDTGEEAKPQSNPEPPAKQEVQAQTGGETRVSDEIPF